MSNNFVFRTILIALSCVICSTAALSQTLADKEGKIRKKVFIFTYAEGIAAEQIDSVKADFLALPSLVDGMI